MPHLLAVLFLCLGWDITPRYLITLRMLQEREKGIIRCVYLLCSALVIDSRSCSGPRTIRIDDVVSAIPAFRMLSVGEYEQIPIRPAVVMSSTTESWSSRRFLSALIRLANVTCASCSNVSSNPLDSSLTPTMPIVLYRISKCGAPM